MPSMVLPMELPMVAVGEPEVFTDFRQGQFPVNGTFARNSTVNGWTAGPVLNTFAIDAPAFVIDPATGKALGYRALAGFTNSLLWSRDLSNAVWSGSATVSQDAVGLKGVANTAWTVTDDNPSGFDVRAQTPSIPDDSNTHIGLWFIKKDADETRLPLLYFRFSGGTTEKIHSIRLNTATGESSDRDTDGASEVVDSDDWWLVKITMSNNSTGNTSIIYRTYPAFSDSLTNDSGSVTGSIVMDYPGVYLNSSIAGPPIETEGSPVSTDTDDGTENVPTGLQSAGTLVISARTANGLSGDQVLAQMDDGTENNRVRLVRNSSREVHYIVTDGGTEVANLNLGTVADDTDTTVAIRYGDDDYAGIISGGTLQTDTTGTMPSISTLRHGRDTADGDEWNGTIAEAWGDDAYTDAQLEGAV